MSLDFSFLESKKQTQTQDSLEKSPESQEDDSPISFESLKEERDQKKAQEEEKKLQEEEAKKQRKEEAATKRKESAKKQVLSSLQIQNGEALSRIVKGIRQGQPLPFLFLLAVKALAQTLNQVNVGEQIEKELIATYGIGLENSEVLDLELGKVRERKTNLENSLELKSHLMKDDERKRLKNAIQEHENEIERLKNLKKKSGICPPSE